MRDGKQVGWRHLVIARARFRISRGATAVISMTKTPLGSRILAKKLAYWLHRRTRYRLTSTVTLRGDRPTHTSTYLSGR